MGIEKPPDIIYNIRDGENRPRIEGAVGTREIYEGKGKRHQ